MTDVLELSLRHHGWLLYRLSHPPHLAWEMLSVLATTGCFLMVLSNWASASGLNYFRVSRELDLWLSQGCGNKCILGYAGTALQSCGGTCDAVTRASTHHSAYVPAPHRPSAHLLLVCTCAQVQVLRLQKGVVLWFSPSVPQHFLLSWGGWGRRTCLQLRDTGS